MNFPRFKEGSFLGFIQGIIRCSIKGHDWDTHSGFPVHTAQVNYLRKGEPIKFTKHTYHVCNYCGMWLDEEDLLK